GSPAAQTAGLLRLAVLPMTGHVQGHTEIALLDQELPRLVKLALGQRVFHSRGEDEHRRGRSCSLGAQQAKTDSRWGPQHLGLSCRVGPAASRDTPNQGEYRQAVRPPCESGHGPIPGIKSLFSNPVPAAYRF